MATEQTESGQEKLAEEESFSATVNHDDLRTMAVALNSLVQEARIHFTSSEMYAKAVDPANVMMVDTGRFEADANKPMAIGVGCESLVDALDSLHEHDGEVTIKVSEGGEEDELLLVDDYWSEPVDYINPNSIRRDPDTDDILDRVEFKTVARTSAWDLVGSVRKVALGAENGIRIYPSDAKILVEGDKSKLAGEDVDPVWGYVDDFGVEFEKSPSDPSESVGMYSPSYLDDLATALPVEGEVTIKLGDNMPVVVESSSGPKAMIAPRIDDPTED